MTQTVKRYGWKPDKPDWRDHKFVPMVSRLPPQAFLSQSFLPSIGDQGEQGSCTGWSSAKACDYLRAASKQDLSLLMSPRFAYWNARVLEGTSGDDSGAEIRDVVKGIKKFGIASWAACPYDDKDWVTPPSREAFNEARSDVLKDYARIWGDGTVRLRQVKQAIVRGWPVIFGFTVYENFEAAEMARNGLMPMPYGGVVGGHAVWIDGYQDDKVVLDQTGATRVFNSWSKDWGDGGHFWMPYAYLTHPGLCDDFWVLRGIT